MASKTTRKTTTTTTTNQQQSTTSTSTSSSSSAAASAGSAAAQSSSASTPSQVTANANMDRERPSSPLSPTRMTRLQEKLELQNLNDRLAAYIDRVRFLETENSRLNVQIQSSQETITREVTSVKCMYEKELNDARRLIDDTSKERARLQIEANKWKNDYEETALKLAKKEKDYAAAEKRLIHLENQTQDLQSRYNQAVADRKRLEDDLKEVQAEKDKLLKQLATTKAQLEEETLSRVDMENRVQSLKEELSFKESMHEKELAETRTIRQTEITEINEQLQENFEQKLQDTLRELRDQYEHQMRTNRDEMEHRYENKLADLQKQADQQASENASVREELRTYKNNADTLLSKIHDLESQNTSALSRIKDLERLLEQERDWHRSGMQAKEDEIKRLREQLDKQLMEYQDLLDIKVALDTEIAAYRKLLEGEESRLNMTFVQSPGGSDGHAVIRRSTPMRRTPVRGTKRKRTVMCQSEERSSSDIQVSASSKGDVEISDHDQEGKFVKLFNKGNQDISIGGWQLIRKAGDQETVFKFHRNVVVKPKAYVTVWSSDCGATHSPPSDIVMKGQKFFVGDSVTTTLLNNNGEEMATRETIKQMHSSLAQRTHETGAILDPALRIGREDIFEHQGDPNLQNNKCIVM